MKIRVFSAKSIYLISTMINKKILFVLVIIMLLIPLKINGQILIDTPVNFSANPGELKVIKVKVTNKNTEVKKIKPVLKKPDGLKLLIPLKKFNLKPNESRILNLIIQIPQKSEAGHKFARLILSTSGQNYHKKLGIKINKNEKIESKVINLPKYVEKSFEMKIKIENQGNTVRKLKITSDSLVEIDNQKVHLNPFQSKIVKIKCNIKSNRDNLLLNIGAVDNNGEDINLISKKVKVLYNKSRYITYQNYLNLNYLKNNNGLNQMSWSLKSRLSKNTELELKPTKFNIIKTNKKSTLQLGMDYNNKIKLGNNKNKSNDLKVTFLNKKKKQFNYLLYTDFKNELGTAVKYHKEKFNTYLEIKKNPDRSSDYYLNTNWFNKDSLLYIRHYKVNKNKYYNMSFFKFFKKRHHFSLGWNRKHFSSSVVDQNFIRYTFNKAKNRQWIVDYRWQGTQENNLEEIQITRGDFQKENDKKNYITFNLIKNRSQNSFEPEAIKLNLLSGKYRLIIKKSFVDSQKSLEYRLNRYFQKENWMGRLTFDNYGHNKTNLKGSADFYFKNDTRITLTGQLSYHSKQDGLEKTLQVSTLIPFKIKRKPFHRQKVKGKILIAGKQAAKNIVLSVNKRKVKTNEQGIFSCSVNTDQPLIIKVIDLGKYMGRYILKQSSPYIIKDYKGEILKFNLIKYGSLNLTFQKPDEKTNKYLEGLKKDIKERAYISLYNEQEYFIKEYNGENTIKFKQIPPGIYQIKIKNLSDNYLYQLTRNKLEIKSGKNILTVKKSYLNRPQLKLKEKPENLKITD